MFKKKKPSKELIASGTEFFDEMHEKMLTEEVKRRKLSKNVNSHPELQFLHFKPQGKNSSLLSKTLLPQELQSANTNSKQSWKPPFILQKNMAAVTYNSNSVRTLTSGTEMEGHQGNMVSGCANIITQNNCEMKDSSTTLDSQHEHFIETQMKKISSNHYESLLNDSSKAEGSTSKITHNSQSEHCDKNEEFESFPALTSKINSNEMKENWRSERKDQEGKIMVDSDNTITQNNCGINESPATLDYSQREHFIETQIVRKVPSNHYETPLNDSSKGEGITNKITHNSQCKHLDQSEGVTSFLPLTTTINSNERKEDYIYFHNLTDESEKGYKGVFENKLDFDTSSHKIYPNHHDLDSLQSQPYNAHQSNKHNNDKYSDVVSNGNKNYGGENLTPVGEGDLLEDITTKHQQSSEDITENLTFYHDDKEKNDSTATFQNIQHFEEKQNEDYKLTGNCHIQENMHKDNEISKYKYDDLVVDKCAIQSLVITGENYAANLDICHDEINCLVSNEELIKLNPMLGKKEGTSDVLNVLEDIDRSNIQGTTEELIAYDNIWDDNEPILAMCEVSLVQGRDDTNNISENNGGKEHKKANPEFDMEVQCKDNYYLSLNEKYRGSDCTSSFEGKLTDDQSSGNDNMSKSSQQSLCENIPPETHIDTTNNNLEMHNDELSFIPKSCLNNNDNNNVHHELLETEAGNFPAITDFKMSSRIQNMCQQGTLLEITNTYILDQNNIAYCSTKLQNRVEEVKENADYDNIDTCIALDDEKSSLMISNSQLLEIENQYYQTSKGTNLESALRSQEDELTTEMSKEYVTVSTQTEQSSDVQSINAQTRAAQRSEKMQAAQKQLGDIIQEIARLNSLILKVRQEVWPGEINSPHK